MSQSKRMMDFAKNGDLAGGAKDLRAEAQRRGHGQRTALAGAGGLVGALLGSFRSPLGAALGALVGAFLGALFGQRRDRPAARRPRRAFAASRALVSSPVIEVHDDLQYIDAVYRD